MELLPPLREAAWEEALKLESETRAANYFTIPAVRNRLAHLSLIDPRLIQCP
jgi:hypothetical protein